MNRLQTAAAALALTLVASCGPSKAEELADSLEEAVVLLEGVDSPTAARAARAQFATLQLKIATHTMELIKDGGSMEGGDAARFQQIQTRMDIVKERLQQSPDIMEALGGELQ